MHKGMFESSAVIENNILSPWQSDSVLLPFLLFLGTEGVASSFKAVQKKQAIFKLGMAPVNSPEGRITSGQAFMIHFKTNEFGFWGVFLLQARQYSEFK